MKENVRARAAAMKEINAISMKGEIVIFGSTYMANFPLYEFINKCTFENAVYNRSIEGMTVSEALEVVNDCVINIRPRKIFLSLGEEDEGDPNVMSEYAQLISELHLRLPECDLYLIGLTGTGEYAENFNRDLMSLCGGKKAKYISFVTKPASPASLYRARFKQLSCFFRSHPLTSEEAFEIANI